MGKYIQQVKNHVSEMVHTIVKKFHNSTVRVAFVGYRDYTEGNARLEVLNLTDKIGKFVSYVSLVKAYAGGDVPEDVLGGLNTAVNLNWKAPTKIIIHIGNFNNLVSFHRHIILHVCVCIFMFRYPLIQYIHLQVMHHPEE